jgi:hypothetical protein
MCKTNPISRLRIGDWGLRIERGRPGWRPCKTNPIWGRIVRNEANFARPQAAGRRNYAKRSQTWGDGGMWAKTVAVWGVARPGSETCKTNPLWGPEAPGLRIGDCGLEEGGRGWTPEAKCAKRTQSGPCAREWARVGGAALSRRSAVVRDKANSQGQTASMDRAVAGGWRPRTPRPGVVGIRWHRSLGKAGKGLRFVFSSGAVAQSRNLAAH